MRNHHLIGLWLAGLLLGGAVSSYAGESVLLATGFRLHADRHEVSGEQVRIFEGAGYVEIPVSSITGFEPDEVATVAPLPASPPPAAAIARPGAPVVALPPTPHELAVAAAKKYSLPESFVQSVMKAESNFRADAMSPKGAIGLMQLMESTAKQLGVNPKIPQENAEGGARYLRELLAKYEHDPNQVILALAAYNAGPEAVERYHGVPPFRETREYILRVIRNWDRKAVQ